MHLLRVTVICAVLVGISSSTIILDGLPRHHKFRHEKNFIVSGSHKHNPIHLDNRLVNEIREAFVDYKRTAEKKPRVTFEEATEITSLRHHHRRYDERLSQDLTPSVETDVSDDIQSRHSRGDNRQPMTRYKRVHTTEAAISQNYDSEYDDNEGIDARKHQKVQVSCVGSSELVKS